MQPWTRSEKSKLDKDLGLPEATVEWIEKFNRGELVFTEVVDVKNAHISIVTTLVNLKPKDSYALMRIEDLIKASAEGYSQYIGRFLNYW